MISASLAAASSMTTECQGRLHSQVKHGSCLKAGFVVAAELRYGLKAAASVSIQRSELFRLASDPLPFQAGLLLYEPSEFCNRTLRSQHTHSVRPKPCDRKRLCRVSHCTSSHQQYRSSSFAGLTPDGHRFEMSEMQRLSMVASSACNSSNCPRRPLANLHTSNGAEFMEANS